MNYLIGHNFRICIIQWCINCTNNALKPVLKTFIQMCNYPLNLFDQACAPIKEREILNAHDDTFWYIGLSYQIKLASHREKKIKWNEMRWWHAYSHTCFIIRLIDCIPKVIEAMFIQFYHMFVISVRFSSKNTNKILSIVK